MTGHTNGIESSFKPDGCVFCIEGCDWNVSNTVFRITEWFAQDDIESKFLRVLPEHSVRIYCSLLMIFCPSILVEEEMVIEIILNFNIRRTSLCCFNHFWGWEGKGMIPFERLEVPNFIREIRHRSESLDLLYPILHVRIWAFHSPKTKLITSRCLTVMLSFS